jgi:hypothetical protein
MATVFEDSAALLRRALERHEPRLRKLDEGASARPRAAGKWSPRQVLGHLADSAVNNYHRLIRAQQGDELHFPPYAQEHWVEAGGYARRGWSDLVDLWLALNRQLAHAMAAVPAEREATRCFIGEGTPVTLGYIARDYVDHLEKHLGQVLDPG